MATKKIKNRYLETLGVTVIILSLVRCALPRVAGGMPSDSAASTSQVDTVDVQPSTIPASDVTGSGSLEWHSVASVGGYLPDGAKPHRIFSVPSYKEAFPDSNALQLTAARKWGVQPVKNRADAEERKRELVYVGGNPYYHVDQLHASIPYLVPRAAILLQDIGLAFFDSLQVKGIPLHRPIVTSVLRTQEDVQKLLHYNKNATVNSCHLYGTTFDISYNRYETVEDPDGPPRREVRNDSLKFVLCEVLRDLRDNERCYIKYEVKQGCFHLTVR